MTLRGPGPSPKGGLKKSDRQARKPRRVIPFGVHGCPALPSIGRTNASSRYFPVLESGGRSLLVGEA
jgi:hypothetical protein